MREEKRRRVFKRLIISTLAMSMVMGSMTAFAEDVELKDVQLITTPASDNIDIKNGTFSLENVLYQTFDQNEDAKEHLGTITIDDVVYGPVSTSEPKYIRKDSIKPGTLTYTSEVWNGDGEEQKPADTMEQDGESYTLKNLYKEESKSQERTETKEATVAYVAVEDSVEIPKEKAITFTDKDTKQEVTANLPLKTKSVNKEYWDDSFQFDITVSGYNAETYMLGEKEIPADVDLLEYRADFIKILALNPEKYEIEKIEWNGDQYEEDGLIKRKAIGKGRKLVQDIDAVYEGEVTLPETLGYVWVAEYEQSIPKGQDVIYTMAVNAEYAPVSTEASNTNILNAIVGAIVGVISAAYTALAASFKTHPVVTSIPFVIIAGFIAFLITRRVRHRCIYKPEIKCPYAKRDKGTCQRCPNFYKRGAAPRSHFNFRKTVEKGDENS